MIQLLESIINELAYGDLLAKQKSINKLFPVFPERVRAVADRGGVRFVGFKDDGVWDFKVHSGTSGRWYEVVVRFKDLSKLVRELAKDKRLWKNDLTGVDLRKLAVEVLFEADLELVCNCPADLYWGGHYIRTQRGAKYTRPETRPPKIRNPKEYGAYCKHLDLVMEVLPMYASTMARYLGDFYKKDIEKAEREMIKFDKEIKKAVDFLQKKLEER